MKTVCITSVFSWMIRFIIRLSNLLARGMVKTRWGKIPCIKVAPTLLTGNVFSDKYGMSVWVTDDENKIPIFAESKIIVGSVKMELIKL